MTRNLATPTATRDELLAIVHEACRAPSLHNTQPWSWRIDGDVIDLYGDPERQLTHTDPSGRELVISCGAGLHHVQMAAHALGWDTTVTRNPEGLESWWLARIHLRPPGAGPRAAWPLSEDAGPDAPPVLQTLAERRTDRRGFGSWEVTFPQLDALAHAARRWGTLAVPVTSPGGRHQLAILARDALTAQAHDPGMAAESRVWVDHGPQDGVPSTVVPAARASTSDGHVSRFGPGLLAEAEAEAGDDEPVESWIVLCSGHDDRAAWLRTGEGLSSLWLRAQRSSLSVVPLSEAVEVPATAAALQELLGGMARPHLVLRLGWQSPVRAPLPPSPRRPLSSVVR